MIKIKNLTCNYGKKNILNNINLEINKKDFVGLIGPNGAGKSTLLKAITKSIKYYTGDIYIEEEDLNNLSHRKIAQKVAVVSQNMPLVNITVKEFVLLGRIPYYKKLQFFENKKDIAIAEHAMELTDVIALQNSYISQISSGELQLALIARALTQEPKILLLDEPTAYLDITHQVMILDIIKKLNKIYELTVIIVLHDLNLASNYCDRLVLINKGEIKKIGIAEEVLNYKDIEEVYKTLVIIDKNPVSLKPFILTVPEEIKIKCEEKYAKRI